MNEKAESCLIKGSWITTLHTTQKIPSTKSQETSLCSAHFIHGRAKQWRNVLQCIVSRIVLVLIIVSLRCGAHIPIFLRLYISSMWLYTFHIPNIFSQLDRLKNRTTINFLLCGDELIIVMVNWYFVFSWLISTGELVMKFLLDNRVRYWNVCQKKKLWW